MNVYTILSLITTILTFGLGLFVYFKTQRNQLSRVFFLFTIALGILSLSQFQMRNASDFQEAWLWSKIFSIWPIVLALSVHFDLELNPKKHRSLLFYAILYLPGIVFSYIQFSTDYIALAPVEKYWGWTIQHNYGIWHNLAISYGIIYWILSVSILLFYYLRFTGRAKKQAFLIFIGIAFNFLITVSSDFLFPLFEIDFPEFGNTADIVPLLLIAYAIWRYDMFTLSKDSLSDKLFTSISNYLLLVDKNGNILEVNQSLLNRLNYSHIELIGQSVDFLLDQNTENTNLLSTHISLSSEFRNKKMIFTTKGGESLPMVFSASHIKIDNSSKPGFIYIGIDDKLHSNDFRLIEENKKQVDFLAEAALDLVKLRTKNEVYDYITEKLYHLLDKKAIIVGTEYSWTDKENSWEIKSLRGLSHKLQELSKLLGFDINCMSGSTNQEQFSLLEEGKLMSIKLDLDALTNGVISKQMTDKAIRLLGIKDFFTISIQHGNQIFGTTSILTKNNTPPLNNELIESFISIASLVLNRQFAEAELKKNEKLFRTIVEDSELLIYIIDREGKFLLSEGKPLKKLGLKPGEAVGMSVYELYKDNSSIITIVKRALKGETLQELIQIKEGFYFNVNYTPYHNEKGELIGTIGMADDISERIVSENRLAELSEMQTKLFKIIGHDLKSPLANILSYSDLILSDFDTFKKNEIQHFIQNIQKAGQNGYQILDDLLEWSKSVQTKTPVNLEKSCLKTKVITAIQQMQPFANKKNIQITNELIDTIPIITDKNMAITVLRNILSNAIKFTNANGHIKILSHNDTSHVYLSISDDGIGISEDQLKTLFDDDIKKPSRGTEGETGSGLGLKICKDFIEKNGGEITVQSKLNEGSVFTLSFPIPDKNKLGKIKSSPN